MSFLDLGLIGALIWFYLWGLAATGSMLAEHPSVKTWFWYTVLWPIMMPVYAIRGGRI